MPATGWQVALTTSCLTREFLSSIPNAKDYPCWFSNLKRKFYKSLLKMLGRGLILLTVLLIVTIFGLTLIIKFSKKSKDSQVNHLTEPMRLADDIEYKYFDIIESDLLRDNESFESRLKLMREVCQKYKDPFR